MRLLLCVLLALTACTARRELVRDDWVPATGNDGGLEVLLRSDYVAQVRSGERRQKTRSLQKRPPNLLEVSSVELGVGEVKELVVEDAQVARIAVTGRAVEAFWGKPYELRRRENGKSVAVKASDVFVKGVGEGTGRLVIELTTGETKGVELVVSAPKS